MAGRGRPDVVVGSTGRRRCATRLELAQSRAVPLGAALVLLHAYDEHAPYMTEGTEAMRRHARQSGTGHA